MNDKYINRGLTNKEVQERISADKINITNDNSFSNSFIILFPSFSCFILLIFLMPSISF